MAFTFKPAIYRDSSLYEFPRPVDSLRVRDSWDFQTIKIPLADGNTVVGGSRQGVEIIVEGRFGSQAGTLTLTESGMFQEIEDFRNALDVPETSDTYSFFLYHDATAGVYRKFKSCLTIRFEFDLSDEKLYSYSAVIHAADPVVYTTAPGG